MKNKLYTIAIAAAALLTACSDDWKPTDENQGGGQLAKANINVVNGENIVSRATADVSNFIVTITDATGAVVNQWVYGKMPELVTLPVGQGYTATVISHNQEKAAWEAPYFEGVSEKFDIISDKITEVSTVSCKLSNVKVSIRFSDDLKKAMGSDCNVTVIANDEGKLVYTPSETRAGYFEAIEGSSTLVATLSGSVNGHYEEIRRIYTDVAPGQHRIITYSLRNPNTDVPDETGTVDVEGGISIDMSTVDESVEGNLAIEEDNEDDSDRPGKEDPITPPGPGPDEPDNPDNPDELFSITSETIDMDGVNQIEEKDYVVEIKSQNPLTSLKVKIISQSLSPDVLAGVGLAGEFDLANPGNLAEGLKGLGFPIGDEVVGKTEVTFNITDFVPLLAGYPDELHQFELTITDDKGNVKVITLKFQS